jgi:tetratricopeptide (TPR) repeat protein
MRKENNVSKQNNTNLSRLEHLIYHGSFKEAQQLVETLEAKPDLPTNERLRCALFKCKLFNVRGEYAKALELVNQVHQESKTLSEPFLVVDTLLLMIDTLRYLGKYEKGLEIISQVESRLLDLSQKDSIEINSQRADLFSQKGIYLYRLGKFDLSLNCLQQSLKLSEKQEDKRLIASNLDYIAVIYFTKGEPDHAFEYHQESLEMKTEIGNKDELAMSFLVGGLIYRQKGELNRALKDYQQGLTLSKEVGNKWMSATIFDHVGIIYTLKGELEQALVALQESLELRKIIGDKLFIAWTLSSIGDLYRRKGELKQAFTYFAQGLDFLVDFKNNLALSNILFQLISVTLDLNQPHEAQQYLKRLEPIYDEEESKMIHYRYLVGKALVLKSGTRSRNRVKAEEILEQVVDGEPVHYELTIIALLNICDLLLLELRIHGDQEVLDEIQKRITQLEQITQHQQIHWFLVETRILKSKLALLNLDLQKAQHLLDQAQTLAIEKGFQNLVIKVASEKDAFRGKVDTWKLLVERNAPMSERIELAQLETQLKRMGQKRIEVTIEDIQNYAEMARKWLGDG